MHKELLDALDEAMASLTERARAVLFRNLCLNETLTGIAIDMRLSIGRVRQIRDKSLQRFRHPQFMIKLESASPLFDGPIPFDW